jgi:hypothetical protein
VFADRIRRNVRDVRLNRASFAQYLSSIPDAITWGAQEQAGATVLQAFNQDISGITDSSQFPGAELLSTAGAGIMDKDNWSDSGNVTLSNPSAGIIRITRNGATLKPFMFQAVNSIGVRYIIEAEGRSDGSASPEIGHNTGATIVTGTTSTDWQSFTVEVEALGTSFIFRTASTADTEYTEWRNISIRTANPLNGDIVGATPGQTFGGNIPLAVSYNGTDNYTDIYSTALNTAFDSDNGGLFAFGLSDTWAAGIDYMMQSAADANNAVYLSRSGTDLILSYTAGGIAESVTIASGSPTGRWMVALTWDTTGGGAVKAYYNGTQSGTTQTIAGTWAGALATTLCNIGANATTPTNPWAGDIATVGLFVGRTPTDAEIADIYQRSGI